MLALTTFLIVLMLAFGIAACIVAVSLTLLMAAVALTVAAIRQSVRVAVKALDASITWIETRTDRAWLRLRARNCIAVGIGRPLRLKRAPD
jgi:hypothetical protein